MSLLVYNGLRVAEVLACDIQDFSHQRGHRVLRIVRKGGKASTEPLAPIVLHTLETYVGERSSGPIFLNAEGTDRLSYSTSHTGWVNAVAFSPDERLLASAGNDGSVRLWDIAAAVQTRVLDGDTEWVTGVAFSPDGRLLASAGNDGSVSLWDLAAGTQTRVLEGHTDWVTGVAFSPDGRLRQRQRRRLGALVGGRRQDVARARGSECLSRRSLCMSARSQSGWAAPSPTSRSTTALKSTVRGDQEASLQDAIHLSYVNQQTARCASRLHRRHYRAFKIGRRRR